VRQGVDVDADFVAGFGLLGLLAGALCFFVQASGVVGSPLEFVEVRLEVCAGGA
jgi:hypothetical protein